MDIKNIRNLIELMVSNDLNRLELREGDCHILLRRGQPVVAVAAPPAIPVAPAPAERVDAAAPPETERYIRSPMVGTFYTSADAESPPFVNVGTVVDPNTVVCLIEAMKVFNELKAEIGGRITKILANNAQAVEFDQPLFAIGPA